MNLRRILLRILFAAALGMTGCAAARDAGVSAATTHASITTQTGVLDGAAYRVDIPPNWNRELIVYYHGYSIEPIVFHDGEPLSPMFAPLLSKGYALIQSGYSQTGWAMEQAYAETEVLRRKFASLHDQPKRTYVMGMSMGGALTALTIETKPEIYAGALSLCGALPASAHMLQHDFDTLAAFEHYFPDVIGPLVPVRADYAPTLVAERRIAQALASNPAAARSLFGVYGVGDARSLAEVLSFDVYIIGELQRRAAGNPFDNSVVVYTGSQDDAELNRDIQRYHADVRAAAYLARWYTPTGKLSRPLLALHDSGDPLVPAAGALEYAQIAQRAGNGERFVPQFIAREGHCVFTPAEIGHAFDELVDWVKHGKRPEAGDLH